jgi:6-phosphogluconolactonase
VWHPLAVDLGPEGAATAYADELDGTVLDVALNGMGPDGHTASLFPGHPMLRAEGIAVAVRDSPKPPPERVTLTLDKLNEARRILLVVTGEDKAPMLARVLAGADPEVPASLLARDRLEVIADAAAFGA